LISDYLKLSKFWKVRWKHTLFEFFIAAAAGAVLLNYLFEWLGLYFLLNFVKGFAIIASIFLSSMTLLNKIFFDRRKDDKS